MATDPKQQLASDLSEVQSKISQFQGSARLNDTRSAIEQLQTTVNGLPQQIAAFRQRGYVFEKNMEEQAAAFKTHWAALYPGLLQQVSSQSNALLVSLHPLEMQGSNLNSAVTAGSYSAPSLAASLKASLDLMEKKIEAAEQSIETQFSPLKNQVDALTAHLRDIDYMLTQLAEAKFQLLATEGGIEAVKAVWCKSGKEEKDDPQGVLYLTDQRILFEQKEEIATKKVLFITTAKQKVQQLLFEAPIALINNIQTNKEGFMKKDDHIELQFAPGAPMQKMHLHIWEDCAKWLQVINRAKARDFDAGRAVAVDQAVVEKVKNVPTQCPSCGGAINQVVLRGVDSVKCEYCGFVIRL
jgi:predicted  nucleic acid-binding Zn-ribbon protein